MAKSPAALHIPIEPCPYCDTPVAWVPLVGSDDDIPYDVLEDGHLGKKHLPRCSGKDADLRKE